MLESIEGKRGLPRNRPPYIAEVGIFGRPTSTRTSRRSGGFATSCRKGPSGSPSRGARAIPARDRGLSPGGSRNPASIRRPPGSRCASSSTIIAVACSTATSSRPICRAARRAASCPRQWATFRSTSAASSPKSGAFVGSHAVVVFSDQDDVEGAVINLLKFFRHESCGQCTPCREGTDKMVTLLKAKGALNEPALRDLETVMRDFVDLRARAGGAESRKSSVDAVSERTPEMTDQIVFKLDGKEVRRDRWRNHLGRGQARRHEDSALCHVDLPGYRVDGNCRACMVEVKGERVLTASCIRKPTAGMDVATQSERAAKSRSMVFELLASNMRPRDEGPDNQAPFWKWASSMGIAGSERYRSKFDGNGRRPRRGRPRHLQSRHRRESRRLHRLRRVRARLPRGAGQRRHRHGRCAAATQFRCSTSTTRWGSRPASPAASACRPARPARCTRSR